MNCLLVLMLRRTVRPYIVSENLFLHTPFPAYDSKATANLEKILKFMLML